MSKFSILAVILAASIFLVFMPTYVDTQVSQINNEYDSSVMTVADAKNQAELQKSSEKAVKSNLQSRNLKEKKRYKKAFIAFLVLFIIFFIVLIVLIVCFLRTGGSAEAGEVKTA